MNTELVSKWQLLHDQYLGLQLSEAMDYERFAMISIVYHSTKIEGGSLTETETKVLIDKGITALGKPLVDHLMVHDHFDAFLFVKAQALVQTPFSVDLICRINEKVMRQTGGEVKAMSGNFDTSKGELRKAQVYVDQKYFPDFAKVPSLLSELVQAAKEKFQNAKTSIEIIRLAAEIHYNVVNIHPFGAGNDRTARLAMNFVQMYFQQPLIKIFAEDRTAYIDALNSAEKNEDIAVFIEFILMQQTKFFQLEIEKFGNRSNTTFLAF